MTPCMLVIEMPVQVSTLLWGTRRSRNRNASNPFLRCGLPHTSPANYSPASPVSKRHNANSADSVIKETSVCVFTASPRSSAAIAQETDMLVYDDHYTTSIYGSGIIQETRT